MKRGQGLPIQFIVIAAIAVLVLVIVIAWATGAFGGLFRGLSAISAATPEEISAFRIKCENACFEAKQLVKSEDAWKNSEYCRITIKNVDQNGDVHCWQEPIVALCEFNIIEVGVEKTCKAEGDQCFCEG